jgi:hypothetical protein
MEFRSGSLYSCDTVSQLRALPSPMRAHNRKYKVCGYYSRNTELEGDVIWDASSIDADDGVLTFKPSDIVHPAPGRFVRVTGAEFDARLGGLRADGTIGDASLLASIHTALARRKSVRVMRLPEGTINLIGAAITVDPTGPAILGSGRWTRLVGPDVGIQGLTFSSQMAETDNVGYQSHHWTQDLSAAALGAGTRVFTGVTNPTGGPAPIAAGDWVYIRFGADPTDAGEEFERTITKIESIVGTTVTVTNPLKNNCPTSVGINVARLANKHDMIRIDKLSRGFEIGNFSTYNMHIVGSEMLGAWVHDIHIETTTMAFSFTQHENTVLERITVDKMTGRDVGGGGIFAHYGWFINGWAHCNFTVRNVDIKLLDGVPFFTYESQSRQMNLYDIDICCDSRNSWNGITNITSTANATQGPFFYNLNLTGYGEVSWDPLTTISGLAIRGNDGDGTGIPGAGPLSVHAHAGTITGSLFFREKLYKSTKFAAPMLLSLRPGETRKIKMPLRGICRRMRIRPSTLTGVTAFRQHNDPPDLSGGIDILPLLAAGQFNEPEYCVTLGHNVSGGFWSDYLEFRVTTDGTVPAGATVEIEAEFWIANDSLTTEPQKVLGGTSPPATNADFIGQEYWDTTASPSQLYRAVFCDSAIGANDWVLVSGTTSSAAAPGLIFTGGKLNGETVYLNGGAFPSSTQLKFPTSARTVSKMRVTKVASTNDVDIVVTLIKGTSAQTQTVTLLTTDGVGTVKSDIAHPITFADGDTFDVRVTGGTGDVSVILE